MPYAENGLGIVAPSGPEGTKDQTLPEEAQRAIAEAAERRPHTGDKAAARKEITGRGGLDPARYGDWEVKGIASDF